MRYLDFESEFESRFPLQIKGLEKSETFLFLYISHQKPLPTHLWQGFALQTEQTSNQDEAEKYTKNNYICTILSTTIVL